MKKIWIAFLALACVGLIFAQTLDTVPDPIILGTDSPRIIDDRMRLLSTAIKNSFGKEHALSGEHRFEFGGGTQLPPSPVNGQLFYDFSIGSLVMWVENDVVYTGTGSSTKGSRVITAPTADFSNIYPGNNSGWPILFYFDADGPSKAIAVDEVTGATAIKLVSTHPTTYTDAPFTIVLQSGGEWVPVDRQIFAEFGVEHHMGASGWGQHKIPIQTNGTEPLNVKSGQFWFDVTNTKPSLYFRDGATSRRIFGAGFTSSTFWNFIFQGAVKSGKLPAQVFPTAKNETTEIARFGHYFPSIVTSLRLDLTKTAHDVSGAPASSTPIKFKLFGVNSSDNRSSSLADFNFTLVDFGGETDIKFLSKTVSGLNLSGYKDLVLAVEIGDPGVFNNINSITISRMSLSQSVDNFAQ